MPFLHLSKVRRWVRVFRPEMLDILEIYRPSNSAGLRIQCLTLSKGLYCFSLWVSIHHYYFLVFLAFKAYFWYRLVLPNSYKLPYGHHIFSQKSSSRVASEARV